MAAIWPRTRSALDLRGHLRAGDGSPPLHPEHAQKKQWLWRPWGPSCPAGWLHSEPFHQGCHHLAPLLRTLRLQGGCVGQIMLTMLWHGWLHQVVSTPVPLYPAHCRSLTAPFHWDQPAPHVGKTLPPALPEHGGRKKMGMRQNGTFRTIVLLTASY